MAKPETQEWLAKASEDIQVFDLIETNRGPWGLAAYHIQQAAEKIIKATLVESGIVPKKSHDLLQLLGELPGPIPKTVEDSATTLSTFAWITRYPGVPPIVESDVIQARSDLEIIQKWAEGFF